MKAKAWSAGYERQRHWFRQLVQVQGSVIPAITPKVILCVLFSVAVSHLHLGGFYLAIPLKTGLIPSIVLGLLLVFRTNTAYDRFWEGRKLWGNLVNVVRNLSRGIWVLVKETAPEDRQEKGEIIKLLVAFSISTKLFLRGETVNDELAALVSPEEYQQLQQVHHPPLRIALWVSAYLNRQLENNALNPYQASALLKLVDQLVDALGACERILKTPMPLAYAIHLKQLVFIYCLSLPFELVDQLLWLTAPIVGLTSFAIFGIEEIGSEIENPFGYDSNDLPLDQICQTMRTNVEDLISIKLPG